MELVQDEYTLYFFMNHIPVFATPKSAHTLRHPPITLKLYTLYSKNSFVLSDQRQEWQEPFYPDRKPINEEPH